MQLLRRRKSGKIITNKIKCYFLLPRSLLSSVTGVAMAKLARPTTSNSTALIVESTRSEINCAPTTNPSPFILVHFCNQKTKYPILIFYYRALQCNKSIGKTIIVWTSSTKRHCTLFIILFYCCINRIVWYNHRMNCSVK